MHRHVFRAKGNFIRTIHATKRYPFLDVDGWEQDTQWRRKQRVVDVVSNILNPAMPGNAFAQRVHDDLTNWHQCHPVQGHDIADAIASASLITTEPCSLCMNADLLQQWIQPTLPQHPSKQHPSHAHSQQHPNGKGSSKPFLWWSCVARWSARSRS